MKKQIIIALSFLAIIVVSVWALSPAALPVARWLGFKTIDQSPEFWHYPRYVRNPHTTLWAVQTGFGHAVMDRSYIPKNQILYYGVIRDSFPSDHSREYLVNEYNSAQAPAGCEYRFLDSAGAVALYSAYVKTTDSLGAIRAQKAWEEIRSQQIQDSIWKREHTYQ